ncbi:hypothetical protein QT972_27245, partial [Microcoleus sp. herbarium7]
MLEQCLYFWQLFKVNELKDRDKYDRTIFNYLKYSRETALPRRDKLTSNRPSILFVSKSRTPLRS